MSVLLLLLACTGPSSGDDTLTVLAASSLSDVFVDLERAFEASQPGVDVRLVFAGSQTLRMQIGQGLDADVYASADRAQSDALAQEGVLEAPRVMVRNTISLVVSADFDGAITLETLPNVERLVIGTDAVPVGVYAMALFDAGEDLYGPGWRTAVDSRVVSRESNVRMVLAKVALGEADAAVVYASDVPGRRVREVGLPAGTAPVATYTHGRLRGARSPAHAARWMEFVESPAGQAIFASRGFR